jgi:tol-pal system protein YbgF
MFAAAARRLALLAAPLVLAACATSPDEDPVMIKMNDLDRRLERLERVLSNQSLLELSQQVQTLQNETRALRGELEEVQHGTESARGQQRDLYADLDRRLQSIEVSTAPVSAEGTAAAVGGLPVPAGSDRANYQAAFDLLKNGDYDRAQASFKQFMATFPDSALADNAQYWLGETYYVTRNFSEALKAFRRVVDNWPESRKLADAWLKIGYCNYELKSWGPARQALQKVVRDFADTGAATEAAKRLERMKAEGH